jgi:hypothetical protein
MRWVIHISHYLKNIHWHAQAVAIHAYAIDTAAAKAAKAVKDPPAKDRPAKASALSQGGLEAEQIVARLASVRAAKNRELEKLKEQVSPDHGTRNPCVCD